MAVVVLLLLPELMSWLVVEDNGPVLPLDFNGCLVEDDIMLVF